MYRCTDLYRSNRCANQIRRTDQSFLGHARAKNLTNWVCAESNAICVEKTTIKTKTEKNPNKQNAVKMNAKILIHTHMCVCVLYI